MSKKLIQVTFVAAAFTASALFISTAPSIDALNNGKLAWGYQQKQKQNGQNGGGSSSVAWGYQQKQKQNGQNGGGSSSVAWGYQQKQKQNGGGSSSSSSA